MTSSAYITDDNAW